jgi:hypothetical protein
MCNRYVLCVAIYLCALYLREAEALPCLGGMYGSHSVSTCWACDGDDRWMKTLFNGILYERNEYHSSTLMGDCICMEGTKGHRNGVFPRCTIIPINTYWGYHKVADPAWWEGSQGYWETTATACPADTHTNYNAPVTDWHGDITGYQIAGANSIAGCLCNEGTNCSSVTGPIESTSTLGPTDYTSTPAAAADSTTDSFVSSSGHRRVSGLYAMVWLVGSISMVYLNFYV